MRRRRRRRHRLQTRRNPPRTRPSRSYSPGGRRRPPRRPRLCAPEAEGGRGGAKRAEGRGRGSQSDARGRLPRNCSSRRALSAARKATLNNDTKSTLRVPTILFARVRGRRGVEVRAYLSRAAAARGGHGGVPGRCAREARRGRRSSGARPNLTETRDSEYIEYPKNAFAFRESRGASAVLKTVSQKWYHND
jgi:hypothetical protein